MRRLSNGEVDQAVSELSPGERRAVFLSIIRACEEDGLSSAEVLRRVASHQFTVHLDDGMIKLVDGNGRCIPPKGMKGFVDPNRSFYLTPPTSVNSAAVLKRLKQFFPASVKWLSESEFVAMIDALIASLQANKQYSNLLNGPFWPMCLPGMEMGDYGTDFEVIYLKAVEAAYKDAFPTRSFKNWRAGDLANKVTIVNGTRHNDVIAEMRSGPVSGLYFPTALQGFGIEADRQMIESLPKGFSLSGPIDCALAIVGDTAAFCRDWNTLGYDCAAVSWESSEYALGFGARGGDLDFVSRDLGASGDCSAGLFFRG